MTDVPRIIPAADATGQADDLGRAGPGADRARADPEAAGLTDAIKPAPGDAGYCSHAEAAAPGPRGIGPRRAPGPLEHREKVAPAPPGRIAGGRSAEPPMASKSRTELGRERDAKREGMIGPILGQVKGLRRLWLRGLSSRPGQWRPRATGPD